MRGQARLHEDRLLGGQWVPACRVPAARALSPTPPLLRRCGLFKSCDQPEKCKKKWCRKKNPVIYELDRGEKCSTKDRPEYTKPLRLCGDYSTDPGCYYCPPTTMCEKADKCDFEEATNLPQDCCPAAFR